jgi:hypothetical protein
VRKIIAPIAPHLAEELYEHDGHTGLSVFLDTWSPSVSHVMHPWLIVDRLAGSCASERHGGDHGSSFGDQSTGRGGQGQCVSERLAMMLTLSVP